MPSESRSSGHQHEPTQLRSQGLDQSLWPQSQVSYKDIVCKFLFKLTRNISDSIRRPPGGPGWCIMHTVVACVVSAKTRAKCGMRVGAQPSPRPSSHRPSRGIVPSHVHLGQRLLCCCHHLACPLEVREWCLAGYILPLLLFSQVLSQSSVSEDI